MKIENVTSLLGSKGILNGIRNSQKSETGELRILKFRGYKFIETWGGVITARGRGRWGC